MFAVYFWWIFELLIGWFGVKYGAYWAYFLGCSLSLISEFCNASALNLLTEFDIFEGLNCSAGCCLKHDNGISGAFDVLEKFIIRFFGWVNWVAVGSQRSEFGNCDAVNIFFNCKILDVMRSVYGAIVFFNFLLGILRFHMLLNFCETGDLGLIVFLNECMNFEIAATTKFSSYAMIYSLLLHKDFEKYDWLISFLPMFDSENIWK